MKSEETLPTTDRTPRSAAPSALLVNGEVRKRAPSESIRASTFPAALPAEEIFGGPEEGIGAVFPSVGSTVPSVADGRTPVRPLC